MKTQFITKEPYASAFLELANTVRCTSGNRPEKFMKLMYENRGEAAAFSLFPMPGDCLERKNPLIVAVGDSVTAGHFEFLLDFAAVEKMRVEGILTPDVFGEVVDVLNGYVDRFRQKLIEKYEATSVSVVNSGIAGDTILGIERRLDRDVLRYQPDLVLVNASLNWMKHCGSNAEYRRALKAVVLRIQNETKAEIVLLTPNAVLPPPVPTPLDHPDSTLDDRVQIIRDIAEELSVCLVDTYKIWEAYKAQGYPIKELLANGSNHPSTAGHEVYARALMQLFD